MFPYFRSGGGFEAEDLLALFDLVYQDNISVCDHRSGMTASPFCFPQERRAGLRVIKIQPGFDTVEILSGPEKMGPLLSIRRQEAECHHGARRKNVIKARVSH